MIIGENSTKLRRAGIPHTRGISTFEVWRTGVTGAEIGLAGWSNFFLDLLFLLFRWVCSRGTVGLT